MHEIFNKELNYDEKVRIEIYRMYVILKMIVDCQIKKYGKLPCSSRHMIRAACRKIF